MIHCFYIILASHEKMLLIYHISGIINQFQKKKKKKAEWKLKIKGLAIKWEMTGLVCKAEKEKVPVTMAMGQNSKDGITALKRVNFERKSTPAMANQSHRSDRVPPMARKQTRSQFISLPRVGFPTAQISLSFQLTPLAWLLFTPRSLHTVWKSSFSSHIQNPEESTDSKPWVPAPDPNPLP